MPTRVTRDFDVIIVGGGHAGVEAATAAARTGAQAAMIVLDPAAIGRMSCNPAIGGLAKGQLVREVDALGGEMGVVTDQTGIQFRMLNTSKGPAVRSPRAQCDRAGYNRVMAKRVLGYPNVTVLGPQREARRPPWRSCGVAHQHGAAETRHSLGAPQDWHATASAHVDDRLHRS